MNIKTVQLDRGSLSLAITAEVDFERFGEFAEPLALALDAKVRERQWGADRHQWLLDFESCPVWLNYEFYGDICWLSVERDSDFEVLAYLAQLLKPHLKAAQNAGQ
ncbi:DUF3630 family protein [Shewanella sp. AS16]|uniref:DUF3630 family protein n=1 Tax=Shewanella sp. AS16 TaxID=2907625 RepID=UPI001F1A0411|nr:DUF3630 family protein [Shewanella sp. AS16]MCE9686012.1 DUF3630 family protein [Shewanella sp. AS16]